MLSSKPLLKALAISLLGIAFSVNAQDKAPSTESVQDFLISSSAADFTAHEQTRQTKVKKVHLRYTENDSGERTYMLCGKFQTANQAAKREWVDFATLKTEGYEQWLGAQAAALCKNARSSHGSPDLSAALQSKLTVIPPAAK